ncbi:MAG: TIGR02147 family protein [Chitinispirillaceae bacterium]|nr:TIGR02147 family protein [Chitinispirillaceae bacterium]
MPNIFEYQNYRLFLKDYYNAQKAAKKYFSYRYFSKKAGINASAFLYYVIEGKRNLTKSSIEKIAAAMDLSKEEKEYFENLVFFNQGKTIAEKAMYYSRIVECRKPLDIKTIDKDQYEFYSKWYHSIIREIACMIEFKDDYALLGSYLMPQISAKEAQASIVLLERIGLIERDENGLYHQTDVVIGVKPAAQDAFIIEKFQIEMLELSRRSFDVVSRAERLSASTTFSISKDTFELFKLKTREFRKELLEIAKLDNEPDRVYQFTFNLFPATRGANEDKK